MREVIAIQSQSEAIRGYQKQSEAISPLGERARGKRTSKVRTSTMENRRVYMNRYNVLDVLGHSSHRISEYTYTHDQKPMTCWTSARAAAGGRRRAPQKSCRLMTGLIT